MHSHLAIKDFIRNIKNNNTMEGFYNRLKHFANWYFSRSAAPYWVVLLVDCGIIFVSGFISFYMIYGGNGVARNFWGILTTFVLFMPGYIIGMRLFHTYSGIVRYSSSIDFIKVGFALAVGTVIAFFIHRLMIINPWIFFNFSSQVLVLTFLLSTISMYLIRMIIKYLYDTMFLLSTQQRAFVYGIHEGGEAIARSIIGDKTSPYVLAGFVTDEPNLTRHRMMGAKVYFNDDSLIDIMLNKHVRTLFVSPLCADALRENTVFLNRLVKNRIKVLMQPAEQEWDGKSDILTTQLHEVEIEDLLPREKIEVDIKAIGELLKDKVVLVTGAAGSIGYEMARQVAKFSPKSLILIDAAETPMHTVRLHMAKHYPNIPCQTIVSSISNQTKMEAIFSECRPDYVFHAAAYKHVPMMEDNPSEAVQNNIYGTRVIADLAVKYGTKKFVMISTDKAVNPTNVMGCSKRICEIYCQALNKAIVDINNGVSANNSETISAEDAKLLENLRQCDGSLPVTQFVTTRFGNVLGSNGSVIPIFKKQIAAGGPVTVTHPDIIRFFMLIPEACRLVLEAGTMGHGGEIFVFDMGKPVRIADLAQRMIDLSGAKNVNIEYTGLRDGEKLFEEVLNDQEQTRPTPHPKIKVAAVREYPYSQALQNEEELYRISFTYDDMAIVKKMKEIVPEYKSKVSKYEVLDK